MSTLDQCTLDQITVVKSFAGIVVLPLQTYTVCHRTGVRAHKIASKVDSKQGQVEVVDWPVAH
jgi:hypothetical protein